MNTDSEVKYSFMFEMPDGTYQEIKKLDGSEIEGVNEDEQS